ncbi:hypothetical protein GCM10028806_28580 [Spirosoma terrae]|uniref:Uncharacterized protein n=1 Tax=Spirosoma terrae TaxID=1968276 RepID=A0A6L9LDH4_9BACT|nr:phage tail family protein [Spirosoma terrae]NDU97181.1 hypothetical protein [Spirosoma terrae]
MGTLVRLPLNGTVENFGEAPVTLDVAGGEYTAGRIDEPALHFPQVGKAEALEQPFPLDSTYSLAFWVKVDGNPTNSWVLYKFSGLNRWLYLNLASPLTRWSYIVILQHTDKISVYLNSVLRSSESMPDGWGKPTGFCVVNDSPAKSGYMTLEDITLLSGVDYSLVKPAIPTPTPTMDIRYSINGTDFKTFGVYVSASDGLLDNLLLKDPIEYEWPDYHGKIVDLSTPRYQPRTISLDCFLKASSADDFIEKVALFIGQFQQRNTQRLKLNAYSQKPHVFEVYLNSSINLKKRWRDGDMVGTFQLTLIEPEPIKRVLSFGAGLAYITLTTSKMVAIHWGDGTHTYNVFGTGVSVEHTYQTPGPHEIIITGVIEDITDFSSNAALLWNKL